MPMPSDASLGLAELAARLSALLGRERDALVDFLRCLEEFDRRESYLPLGHGSCFDYCTKALRLSNAAAYRRITAARLLRRFPEAGAMLRDGRLCLTTLALLKDVLTADNRTEILKRAAGLTKEQVEALVVLYRPRKAPPRDAVLALPKPKAIAVPVAPAGPSGVPDPSGMPARIAKGQTADAELDAKGLAEKRKSEERPAAEARAEERVAVPRTVPLTVQPLDEELRVLRATVSRAFLAELEEVRAILSHQAPSGKFEDVMRACFRVVIEQHRKKTTPKAAKHEAESTLADRTPKRPAAQAGTSGSVAEPSGAPEEAGTLGSVAEPRGPTSGAPPAAAETGERSKGGSRRDYIPIAVRRAVWARDGAGGCTFVGSDGRRCGSRYKLQLEHIIPQALGGPTTVENCCLLCAAHNGWTARLAFGEQWMSQFRRPRGSDVEGEARAVATRADASASGSNDRAAHRASQAARPHASASGSAGRAARRPMTAALPAP